MLVDDYNRVVLDPLPHGPKEIPPGGDYINASFVDVILRRNTDIFEKIIYSNADSLRSAEMLDMSTPQSILKPNAYLVCQGPLDEQVNEFWRMVWQKNVTVIIMLTKVIKENLI